MLISWHQRHIPFNTHTLDRYNFEVLKICKQNHGYGRDFNVNFIQNLHLHTNIYIDQGSINFLSSNPNFSVIKFMSLKKFEKKVKRKKVFKSISLR
jgi:hypothetical protein